MPNAKSQVRASRQFFHASVSLAEGAENYL